MATKPILDLSRKSIIGFRRGAKPFRRSWIWALLLSPLMFSACGGIQHTVVTQPDNILTFKEITLLPTEVTSEKKDAYTIALNEALKKMATDELQSLLNSKNIRVLENSNATVGCRIEVAYGNRAMRYWVGFGAGAGHITVAIDMKDGSGVVRYATSSNADLAIDGSMTNVAYDAILTAVKEFGKEL